MIYFNLVIFASWILYGMTAAAVIVLRRKQPNLIRPYRTLGYPVIPMLFVTRRNGSGTADRLGCPRESATGNCINLRRNSVSIGTGAE